MYWQWLLRLLTGTTRRNQLGTRVAVVSRLRYAAVMIVTDALVRPLRLSFANSLSGVRLDSESGFGLLTVVGTAGGFILGQLFNAL